ncbi:hypothetical protein ABPG72_007192 [Tetrahymena utriculariae]
MNFTLQKESDLEVQYTMIKIQLNFKPHHSQINSYFQYNQISSSITNLGETLGQYQNLLHINLNLKHNKITDTGLKQLTNGLSNCKKINQLILNLENNQIKSQGVSETAYFFGKFENLSILTLNFGELEIGDKGSTILGDNLSQSKNLKSQTLDLSPLKITKFNIELMNLKQDSINSVIKEYLVQLKLYHNLEISNFQSSIYGTKNINQGLFIIIDIKKALTLTFVKKEYQTQENNQNRIKVS